jgi:hypothetical protein
VRNWGLRPTVFYRWQKEFFENGAFQSQERPTARWRRTRKRLEFLEKKVRTKDEVLAECGGARRVKKNTWGTLTGSWVPHDVRDQVVDFVRSGRRRPRSASGDSFIGCV